VRFLARETVDLVLDRGAVTGADAFDDARVHGAAVEAGADDVVRLAVRVRDPARHLARVHGRVTHDGKHGHGIEIARLFLHHGKVDAAAIDARRRARFQAALRQFQLFQAGRQGDGGRVAGAAGRVIVQAHVDLAVEESPRRQHHGARQELQADLRHRADDTVAFDDQIIDGLLEQPQVRLVFQARTDGGLVQNTVGLGARGAHCRAFRGIQDAELDAGLVGGDGHRAAHGIDFLDQVALADAADGRIARHLAQCLDIMREQKRLLPHAGGSEGRLGTGVTTTDNDDVEFCRK